MKRLTAPIAPPDFTMILDRDGACVLDEVVPPVAMRGLIAAIESVNASQAVRQRRNGTFAVRNALRELPAAVAIADHPSIQSLARTIVGTNAMITRAIIFDKNPDANWAVPWHQDTTIAVMEKIDTPGFGPWSVKAGVVHVQPPAEVLDRMVTLRIHLDDCDSSNGALQVLPGSHGDGVLSNEQIEAWKQRVSPLTCEARAGGVVLMRPLVLHASAPAASPRHRRVLHLEFAGNTLPNDLRWANA